MSSVLSSCSVFLASVMSAPTFEIFGEVRSHKCDNVEIVDDTTPKSPAVKRKTKPTPPSLSAAATRWLLRSGTSIDVQEVAHDQRIRIVIPPGRTRLVDPQIASMYATTSSVVVNDVVPIFPHWKDYKERSDVFSGFARHLSVSFVTQLFSSFHCCLKK